MAYTFVLNEDNCLAATKRETIMQRSKLVDDIFFLVNPEYKSEDMNDFNVTLEYVLPVSKRYCTLALVPDDEGYEEYIKYVVPLDTNLSSEAGDVELQLTFTFVGIDPDGNPVQKVRKTKTAKLRITPISAWSDIVPDEALTAIDQRLIKADAQIREIGDYAVSVSDSKADNIRYDISDGSLTLLSGDDEIGSKVTIITGSASENGVPVVDLGGDVVEGDGVYDVVEF